ncbi:hypothetical protein BB559_004867 [Furculomyces boomerangus]|uniref:RGS domain-containing protein n=1 Tax=Furculomyces boomerangus TaxID=61424 RepID=A0A2T9YC64_9FUNG|nr:hypothetical protein BB559_005615 [Furculomyces boomerangus]PVU89926.1 hypothetical protein BB559_004867 [Furculomyces boomerangus]
MNVYNQTTITNLQGPSPHEVDIKGVNMTGKLRLAYSPSFFEMLDTPKGINTLEIRAKEKYCAENIQFVKSYQELKLLVLSYVSEYRKSLGASTVGSRSNTFSKNQTSSKYNTGTTPLDRDNISSSTFNDSNFNARLTLGDIGRNTIFKKYSPLTTFNENESSSTTTQNINQSHTHNMENKKKDITENCVMAEAGYDLYFSDEESSNSGFPPLHTNENTRKSIRATKSIRTLGKSYMENNQEKYSDLEFYKNDNLYGGKIHATENKRQDIHALPLPATISESIVSSIPKRFNKTIIPTISESESNRTLVDNKKQAGGYTNDPFRTATRNINGHGNNQQEKPVSGSDEELTLGQIGKTVVPRPLRPFFQDMFNTYFNQDSESMLNLPGSLIASMVEMNEKKNFTYGMFDSALENVLEMLYQNVYTNSKKSTKH